MDQDLTRYKEFKERRKEVQEDTFLEVVNANDSLITLTYIELALIIGVGAYQFYAIRNFLVQKQYLWNNDHQYSQYNYMFFTRIIASVWLWLSPYFLVS